MLNAETKRHIDSARNILVGVAPSPMTQVDLITTTLIYKFMDDMDQQSIKAGGNPKFFTGDLEKYSWSNLIDDRLDNQGKVNLFTEALTKFATSENLTPLFREIFKNTFLPFRNPSTFKMFIDEINYFDYSHAEELGNAFEYLLTILSVSGDAGQFRTPRNIIQFIVDVVDPKKDDKVLDPACGTAGFLVEAFNHILEQHDGRNDPENNEIPLSPEERINLMNNIEGYDITPEMARLSSVNLFLHGFKTPKIYEYDTLSSEEKWNDKFDVILANPPFMTPTGGIVPHSKFSIKAKRSEVLFVDYILSHLKSKGRAGIIVPEGVIFQSGNAFKELRKKLLDEGLYCVASLPAGVFNPYAGVKTSILFIDKELAKTKDEILFIKIENDGFDLGAQRRPIDKNDLPEALDLISRWKKNEKLTNKLVINLDKESIFNNEILSLNIDSYLTNVNSKNDSLFNIVKISEITEIKKSKANLDQYPYLEIGDIDISSKKYTFKDKKAVNGALIASNHNIVISKVRPNRGAIAYIEESEIAVTNGFCILQVDTNKVLPKFLYFILAFNKNFYDYLESKSTGATYPTCSDTDIISYSIPLPSIETQQEIVEELDRYQNIIDGAKKIIDNWKPSIYPKEDWEEIKISDIGEVKMCKRIFKEQTQPQGEIPFYKIGTFGKKPDAYINKSIFDEYSSRFPYPKKGDILISASGTIGKTVTFDGSPSYFQDSNIVWVDNNEKKVYNNFLNYLFQNINWTTSKGATIERLYNRDIEDQLILVPNLNIQREIVLNIEKEKEIIQSASRLVEIYEQKIKDKVNSLWKN